MIHVERATEALSEVRDEGVSRTGRDLVIAMNFAVLWLMLILALIGVYFVDHSHPPPEIQRLPVEVKQLSIQQQHQLRELRLIHDRLQALESRLEDKRR